MVITYQGENYLKIQSGASAILVDPADERSFRGTKVVLHTVTPSPLAKGRDVETLMTLREPLWIDRPGEYEVEGIRITGYHAGTRDGNSLTMYRVVMEGIALGILGHLAQIPGQEVIGAMSDVDVLFIPGGGSPWLKESEAAKLVRQIEPGIVVPTLLTKKTCDVFAKELGNGAVKPSEKLVVKKKDIMPKAMTIACLTT